MAKIKRLLLCLIALASFLSVWGAPQQATALDAPDLLTSQTEQAGGMVWAGGIVWDDYDGSISCVESGEVTNLPHRAACGALLP